jgi:hypothetical protein
MDIDDYIFVSFKESDTIHYKMIESVNFQIDYIIDNLSLTKILKEKKMSDGLFIVCNKYEDSNIIQTMFNISDNDARETKLNFFCFKKSFLLYGNIIEIMHAKLPYNYRNIVLISAKILIRTLNKIKTSKHKGLFYSPTADKPHEDTAVVGNIYDEYVHSLRNKVVIYDFAARVLYNIIKRSLTIGIDIHGYINYDKTELKDRIILNKSGIPKLEGLLETETLEEFVDVLKTNGITFLQIMGSIYRFTYDTEFISKIVKNDPSLSAIILEKFKHYFAAPPSFTYTDLEELVEKSAGFWFIPWLIIYTTSDKHNLVRHNLNYDADYVREWLKNSPEPKYYDACHDKFLVSDVKECTSGKRVDMRRGSSYYKPTENGVYVNLMNKYKRNVIAGPSGSAVSTYQLLFNILKICTGNEDKVMLLLCLIGDYYPIHHSIEEILILYPDEAGLEPYDLSTEPLSYIKSLVDTYLSSKKSEISPVIT